MRPLYVLIGSLSLLFVAGCAPFGPEERDLSLCPQTREFGNHGCARFAAILTTLGGAPAAGIMLRAHLLDSASAGQPSGLVSDRSDATGRVGLQLTWYVGPPTSDTINLRLVAFRVPPANGPPPPIDSLDVRVLFTRVGQRPPFDTTRWRLRE